MGFQRLGLYNHLLATPTEVLAVPLGPTDIQTRVGGTGFGNGASTS